jgi:hypothetical protein
MVIITETEVKDINGKKHWVVTRNDYDKVLEGEITSGPINVNDVKVGTKYKTELSIIE